MSAEPKSAIVAGSGVPIGGGSASKVPVKLALLLAILPAASVAQAVAEPDKLKENDSDVASEKSR